MTQTGLTRWIQCSVSCLSRVDLLSRHGEAAPGGMLLRSTPPHLPRLIGLWGRSQSPSWIRRLA